MLRQIWQWLKNLYQRWFTKPTPPPPPKPPRPDTEYENLFFQLLEEVSQGASRGNVKGFLISHKVKEAELIAWLERFRTKLETNPPANPAELSRHLQQLNQLGLGELSSLAGNIAQQLSGGSPQPPLKRGAEEGISGSPLFKGGGGGSSEEIGAPQPQLKRGAEEGISGSPLFKGGGGGSNEESEETDTGDDTPPKHTPHLDAVDLVNQGFDLYNAGNIQGALECCNRAIEIDPKYVKAWNGKGIAHSSLKQYQDALECCNRALEIDPKYVKAWNGKGNVHLELKQYPEAISCFNRALEIDPNFHYAWTGKGNVHLELKQYQEAISCYERAIKIDSNYLYAWHKKGNVHLELKQYQEAISCYERALKIDPNYLNTWHNKGNAHYYLKQYQEAMLCYERALEIDSKSHHAWNGKGNVLLELKQYQDAMLCYERALEIDRNFHYAWNSKGNVHKNLKQYQEAILYYERALEIDRNFQYAWNGKGNVLLELKQYQEAISCYERALEIDRNFQYAWHGKGNVYLELKQYQEAISCYERALEIDRNHHYAWNSKGNVNYYLKQYQEAISCYERALEIDRNLHPAWSNKGTTHYYLKQYQEAISCYQQALALTDNKDWNAWGNWGWALLVLLGEDAALAKWDEALQFILPQEEAEGCGRLHQYKGKVYYRKGNKEYDSSKPFINPYPHWEAAHMSYLLAKQHLAKPHLPVQYLELLVNLAQVCHALAQRYPEMGQEAADVVTEGITCLERFLSELSSELDKRFYAQKFITFARLRVDTLLDEGDATAALRAAEDQKNLSLRWMQQNRYVTDPPPVTIEQMQQLLAPNRAIIHWHISDQAITTFILTEALTPAKALTPAPLPQVWKLENWLKQWKENYRDYRKPREKEGKEAGEQGTGGVSLNVAGGDARTPHPSVVRASSPATESNTLNVAGGDARTPHPSVVRASSPATEPNTLDVAGGDARTPQSHPWRVTMETALAELRDILEIDKILPHLQNISQLILIPHRDLHLLPLEYLFPQLEITRIPSAYFGWERLYFPATGGESRLSIEYPPTSKPGTSSKKELLFAEAEAGYIAHLYPHSHRISHRDATKEGVMAAVQASISAQIFHFTGHGVHDLDNPDNSGLQMADGELLTMRDLFDKLQLPAYMLVCLSACETGIASQKDLIDEFVGLTSPFLTAKTTHIVSTLWSVEEISTCMLMIEFFRLFQNGKPGNIALAEAKAWLRKATNSELSQWWEARAEELTYEHLHYDTFKARARSAAAANPDECPYEHPYFWAGFTVTGKVN